MTNDDAESALADVEVVPYLEAGIRDAKELLAACLDADIPAVLDRAECCARSGCGCAPKAALCVRPDDAGRVAALLDARWQELRAREAVPAWDDESPAPEAPEGGGACPACGTAAPLAEGCCSDCGLRLA